MTNDVEYLQTMYSQLTKELLLLLVLDIRYR